MYRREFNRYHKLKTKLTLLETDINFLKDCRRYNVVPRFIKVNVNLKNKRSSVAVKHMVKVWLKNELNYLYRKREKLEFEVYVMHLKLTKNLNNIEYNFFNTLVQTMRDEINRIRVKKILKLKDKIKKLKEEKVRQRYNSQISTPRDVNNLDSNLVINQSNENFSDKELELLKKGLKFAVKPKKPPLEQIIADIELGIAKLPEDTKQQIRLESKTILEQHVEQFPNQTNRNYHSVINTLKNRDCFYVKADKGNSIVILNKVDYKNRMLTLINEGPYVKLNKNPLSRMEKEVDLVLKKYQQYFNEPYWKLKLKSSNPTVPRLYGLPKLHKPGNKMREIASNINAPSEKLSKWLVKEFGQFPSPPGKFVLNTYEFIEKVKETHIYEDECLVSFDVTALFPSIPIPETLDFLRDWLGKQSIDDWRIDMYCEMTKVCMNQNVFNFDNQFYQQCNGTAMGNSLSPFLANLFMSYFENEMEKEELFPRVWIRYVDDIFAIQKKDLIESTTTLLNSRYDSVKFTTEKEENNCLPFLDIKVINNSGTLEFDIFRKATHTPRFITHDSFHSFAHKYSAFNSMTHRLVKIPLSDENFEKELNYILLLAEFNGLREENIRKSIDKKLWTKHMENECKLKRIKEDSCNKKYVKLTYFPPITDKLAKMFKKVEIIPAYSSGCKLSTCLGNPKSKINELDKSGVYQIKCKSCNAKYVGMTSRKLKTRFKDHLNDVKNKTSRTALAKHILEENEAKGRGKRNKPPHDIDWNCIKLIKENYNWRELCIWESIHIIKNNDDVINDNFGAADTVLTRWLRKSSTTH